MIARGVRMRILMSIQGDQDFGVLQIQPNHFVKFDTASAVHLPRAR